MSTGADNKTMPCSAAFRDGYDRAFGERTPQRGRWVVTAAGLVPASEHIPPHASGERVPLVSDTFMDGAVTQDGINIGSKRKRSEYMHQRGIADASDYSASYVERKRVEREAAVTASTARTVAELANVEMHNLPKAIEELRRKK